MSYETNPEFINLMVKVYIRSSVEESIYDGIITGNDIPSIARHVSAEARHIAPQIGLSVEDTFTLWLEELHTAAYRIPKDMDGRVRDLRDLEYLT